MTTATEQVAPAAGFLSRPDFVAACGGVWQAVAEILAWPVPHGAARVALAILVRQYPRRSSTVKYNRASYAVIARTIGRRSPSNRTITSSVRVLLEEGYLWTAFASAPRFGRLYYFKQPVRDDSERPPPAMPAMPRPEVEVGKDNPYINAMLAESRRQQKVAKRDTPLVGELDRLLGSDRKNHYCWCKMQAVARLAIVKGYVNGLPAAVDRWLIDKANAAAKDVTRNPASTFTAWFKSQPGFAKAWLELDAKKKRGPR